MEKSKIRYRINKTVRVILLPDNPLIPQVLRELLKIADRKNVIHLNSYRRQTILRNLRITNRSSSYIRVTLRAYLEQNYLVKIAEDTFMINPCIAFNCSNQEFFNLLQVYDQYCQVAYSNKKPGRKKTQNKIQNKTQNKPQPALKPVLKYIQPMVNENL